MPRRFIVRGQVVSDEKKYRARELRTTMTPAERELWGALKGKQLAGLRFRRQQVIAGYIVDFYCHEVALIVEVDGGVHETQQEWDQVRDQVLHDLGLTTLRVTNDDVLHDLKSVITRIDTAITNLRTEARQPLSRQ